MRTTYILVLATLAAFLLQMAFNFAGLVACEAYTGDFCIETTDLFTKTFYLMPSEATSYAFWQFFTYMFLHADISHIAINMFVLLIFGVPVEMRLKRRNFLLLYFLAGIGSAVFHLAVSPVLNPADWNIALLGASGAVFGILTAYAFLYPKNIIWMFPGIPLPAIIAVFAIAGFELLAGITGISPGIANFGHLGGIIAGVAFMLWWRRYGKKGKKMGGFEWIWENF